MRTQLSHPSSWKQKLTKTRYYFPEHEQYLGITFQNLYQTQKYHITKFTFQGMTFHKVKQTNSKNENSQKNKPAVNRMDGPKGRILKGEV